MDFELQHMRLDGYQTILDTVLVQEETIDSVVPDTCPDVARVVCAMGNGYVSAKTVGEGSVRIGGEVCVNVLYQPEGENAVRTIKTVIPFQCTADRTEFNETSLVQAEVVSVSAEARLMNPRKLFVRAEVRMRVVAYNHKTKDIVCDLATKSDSSIQTKYEETSDHTICAVLEKTFTFSESLHRSGSKPSMDELLFWTINTGTIEVKYIGKNLITKGDLILSVCYRAEEQVVSVQFELPFSQIIDVEGSFNECEPSVLVALKSADCRLVDGELEVSVDAVLQAVLWLNQKVVLLNDIYSTEDPLESDRAMCTICSAAERNVKRESYRKFCESAIPARQAIFAVAHSGPLTAQYLEQDIRYDGFTEIAVLYYTEDDALAYEMFMVPISYCVQRSGNTEYTCCAKTLGDVTAVPVTGGFELRFEVEFSLFVTAFQTTSNVTSVRNSTVAKTKERRPSVILRMTGKEEDLWEIAKSCSSTIEDIRTANQLSSEVLKKGSVLLIPAHR